MTPDVDNPPPLKPPDDERDPEEQKSAEQFVQKLKALGEKMEFEFSKPDPSILEYFDNPHPVGFYSGIAIVITTDEFTSLCPKTGQPDWARIVISYRPNHKCVESKSLKLYLAGYRNHGEFHEACVSRILNDLVALLTPEYMRVEGRFTPRGGIAFWPIAIHDEDGIDLNELTEAGATGMFGDTEETGGAPPRNL